MKWRIDGDHAWAANGLLKFCALRNALVHGGAKLGPKSVQILAKAGAKNVVEGHEVRLSFGDLFRYRRALRTVLGELRKKANEHHSSRT